MKTNQRDRSKVHFLLIGLGTLIPLLSVGVATATFLPGDLGSNWQQRVLDHYLNPLAQIQAQWTQEERIRERIMEVALGGAWGELQSQTSASAPDPYQVRTIETKINPGVLATNSVIRQRDVANLYDQELSRSMAAPVLGETGRIWLEQEAGRSSKMVETSQKEWQEAQKLAQQAQSLTVTQDVMKNNAALTATLAGMVTHQSQLTADNHTALLQMQQFQGVLAQLSANTSEGIDEANRRERVNRELELGGATRTELYIPGLYGVSSGRQSGREP